MENFENTEVTEDSFESSLNPDQSEAVPTQIAGFWRRILALGLDSIIIGIVGSVLGALFFDQFVVMGDWARLIGLGIFLAYFGLQNSQLCGGQTLGKRALKIRVVDGAGESISIRTSMLRTLILGLPGIVNNLTTAPGFMNSPLKMVFWFLVAVILFGGGVGIVYFYIFNRNTRQSLHDLICGTYVVSKEGSGPIQVQPVWRGHYIAYGIVIGLIVVAGIGLNMAAERIPFFKNLLAINDQMGSIEGVYGANISKGTTYSSYGQSNYLTVVVQVRDRSLMTQEFATKVVANIMKNSPESTKVDMIKVVVNYGYDIGIASGYVNNSGSFSPDEWRNMIDNPSGDQSDQSGAFATGIQSGTQ